MMNLFFSVLVLIPIAMICFAIFLFRKVKKDGAIENRIVCWQCYNLFIRNNYPNNNKDVSNFLECDNGSKLISSLKNITNLEPNDIKEHIKLMNNNEA